MNRHSVTVIGIALLLLLGALAVRYLPGLWPVIGPVAPVPSSVPTTTGGSPAGGGTGPLISAPGWTVSLLTDAVPGARDMELDENGNVWVSQTSQGTVSLVSLRDPRAPDVTTVLKGLDRPHGLAFDPRHPGQLYLAQETSISILPIYSGTPLQKIADLPPGGRHFTRSLIFGDDGRLYVTIGSTCDACREKNPENGSIISMNPDGSDRKIVATGLRNAVFITKGQHNGQLLVTEMGRDYLGDRLPPDEVDLIEPALPAKDYGWPICYGSRIHDTEFDMNIYIRDPCADTAPPLVELPAHVAPLGLSLFGRGDLLVAEHGSWNSSVPVGYKVVRLRGDGSGFGDPEDFLTGFLNDGAAIGRPVDVLPMSDGSVLVSDDKRGAIWRMEPAR